MKIAKKKQQFVPNKKLEFGSKLRKLTAKMKFQGPEKISFGFRLNR